MRAQVNKLLIEKTRQEVARPSMPDKELLLADFRTFKKYFFKLCTNQEYVITPAENRQCFDDIIDEIFLNIFNHNPAYQLTDFHCPPSYGKSINAVLFMAYGIANYGDSRSMYLSYSGQNAKKNTRILRSIIMLPEFYYLFGIKLSNDSKAVNDFILNTKGTVLGTSLDGTVTGHHYGLRDVERYGGILIMDDMHKPNEVTSQVMRESVHNTYKDTIKSRSNNPRVTPEFLIMQRVHEDDLPAKLQGNAKTDYVGFDGRTRKVINVEALNKNGHALMPSKHTAEDLKVMEKTSPYVFASQYQQNPSPAGGGIYRRDWFYPLLDDVPDNIGLTFVTADTAETVKKYNDATSFSFWGLYKLPNINEWALHWINNVEIRVEPADLEREFMSFYNGCCNFPVKPMIQIIERKSTGVTLCSLLKKIRGLNIIEIVPTKEDGDKSDRFIKAQPYISSGRVTMHEGALHNDNTIDHMTKITANNTHAHDDIADTAYMAIKAALIDQSLVGMINRNDSIKTKVSYPTTRTQTFKSSGAALR
jgi:predicted phage terminase large subunit-like protein